MQAIKLALKFFFLVTLVGYVACMETGGGKTTSNAPETSSLNEEAYELTGSVMIAKNMVGTWRIGGGIGNIDSSVILFDGTIEFDAIYYSGRIVMGIIKVETYSIKLSN